MSYESNLKQRCLIVRFWALYIIVHITYRLLSKRCRRLFKIVEGWEVGHVEKSLQEMKLQLGVICVVLSFGCGCWHLHKKKKKWKEPNAKFAYLLSQGNLPLISHKSIRQWRYLKQSCIAPTKMWNISWIGHSRCGFSASGDTYYSV